MGHEAPMGKLRCQGKRKGRDLGVDARIILEWVFMIYCVDWIQLAHCRIWW
jgi:hypothetical protein